MAVIKNSITFQAVAADPQLIAQQVQLPTNETAWLRPLTKDDAGILGVYFLSLSDETKRRYGPHPFDQATADKLCAENDYNKVIRMLATVPQAGSERVIAYFILVMGVDEDEIKRYAVLGIGLDSATDCTLAPSVADDYQDKGVGSIVMRHVIDSALRLGKTRMVLMGGTQGTNARGIHFYKKYGFRIVGDFQEPTGFNNHDMILDLAVR